VKPKASDKGRLDTATSQSLYPWEVTAKKPKASRKNASDAKNEKKTKQQRSKKRAACKCGEAIGKKRLQSKLRMLGTHAHGTAFQGILSARLLRPHVLFVDADFSQNILPIVGLHSGRLPTDSLNKQISNQVCSGNQNLQEQ
jgi:hypothetical protein